MEDSIDQVIQRTQRYWYVDGLSEIAVGVIFWCMSLFYYLIGAVKPQPLSALAVAIGQPLIVLLGALGAKFAVKALKERLTYPRTGYLTYPSRNVKSRLKTLVFALLISAGLALLIIGLLSRLSGSWIPLVTSAILALSLAYLAYRFGLARFYGLAIFTLALGLLTAYLSLSDPFNTAFFFAGFGLGWVVSGSLTLWNYLRNTRPEEAL